MRSTTRLFTSALFLTLFSLADLPAQSTGLQGTEFWFGVPQNFRDQAVMDKSDRQAVNTITLMISSRNGANVNVKAAGEQLPVIKVDAGSTHHLLLPMSVVSLTPDTITNAAVCVTSDQPVALQLMSNRYQTTEIMSILPLGFYGTSYTLASYTPLTNYLVPTVVIVATEDHTTVTLRSNERVKWTTTHSLGRGQAIRLDGRHKSTPADSSRPDPGEIDLTGFTITSSKPVSVVTGHTCAYVPAKTDACNMLMEHLVPNERLGKRYVIPKIPGRAFQQVRVIPIDGDARFRLAGMTYHAKEGDFKEITMEGGPFELTSDVNVLVAAYTPGFKSGDSTGDPSMVIIPPVDAWEKECVVSAVDLQVWTPSLTVVGTQEVAYKLRINGKTVSNIAAAHSMDGFMQVEIPVTEAYMHLESPVPMLVLHSSQTKDGVNAYDGYATFLTWKLK
jgi:hypothetical protein